MEPRRSDVKEHRTDTDTPTKDDGERLVQLGEVDRRGREVVKAVLALAPGLLVLWAIATFATGNRPVLGAFVALGYFGMCCGVGYGYSRSRARVRTVTEASPR